MHLKIDIKYVAPQLIIDNTGEETEGGEERPAVSQIKAQLEKLEAQAKGMQQKLTAQKQAYASARKELDAAQK